MGNFTEEITLTNVKDEAFASGGYISKAQVRQVTVSAIVDTGATTVVIGEATRQQLGLGITGKKTTTFANGAREECGLTEPVYVRWNERSSVCNAVVIPGARVTLLGAIPLEDMDLKIDVVNRRLERAHGDSWEILALLA